MKIIKTELEGVVIIAPDVFSDSRGYFLESFTLRKFEEAIGPVDFIQDNESSSTYGVVRGLHYQKLPYTQSKLVRCVSGSVLDVVVDIRKGSPTFMKHVAVELSGENHLQMFIPKGFAHGFSVLSERAVFQYKCDNYYAPSHDSGIYPLDPALGIDWRIPREDMILSDKDLYRAPLDVEHCDFEYSGD